MPAPWQMMLATSNKETDASGCIRRRRAFALTDKTMLATSQDARV